MNIPADLVVSTTMHTTAMQFERGAAVLREPESLPTWHETIARTALVAIGHQASLRVVLAALAAAGGPGNLDEIAQRFQAVRDMRAGEDAMLTGLKAAQRPAPTPGPEEALS